MAGWAGVFPEFDRSGAASGWTPRTRERFANHITGPSIRIGGQAQRCPPDATRPPLPAPGTSGLPRYEPSKLSEDRLRALSARETLTTSDSLRRRGR
ncbi:hypothetical protein AB691_4374 [Stutzerimonas stutzeri]|nr:hypothetical protein AB691_4374 [Stutzerimonas stutzeri]